MTETERTFEPGLWEVSNRDYHADRTAFSHSALEVFDQSIPLFHGRYITGEIPAPEPSAAMQLGSAFEAYLLEPDYGTKVFTTCPKINRRTNAGKEEWARFQEEANGRIILEDDDMDRMEAMEASVQDNDIARHLVHQNGKVQQAFRWIDWATELPLKAKLDKWFPEGLIIDLKTAEDPSPKAFARSAANYGYFRQSALYLDGAKEVLGLKECQFLFLVVGTSPPHEVIVYEPDPDHIQMAREQNRELLSRLAHCQQTGDWSGRWSGEVQTLKLPRWAITTKGEIYE